jgi:hypothetical protein
VNVPEIFQAETPQGPGGLASVLNAMAEAAGQLLPDPLDVTVHERVSRAVQAAGAAQESLAAELRDTPRLPDAADPQSETT